MRPPMVPVAAPTVPPTIAPIGPAALPPAAAPSSAPRTGPCAYAAYGSAAAVMAAIARNFIFMIRSCLSPRHKTPRYTAWFHREPAHLHRQTGAVIFESKPQRLFVLS